MEVPSSQVPVLRQCAAGWEGRPSPLSKSWTVGFATFQDECLKERKPKSGSDVKGKGAKGEGVRGGDEGEGGGSMREGVCCEAVVSQIPTAACCRKRAQQERDYHPQTLQLRRTYLSPWLSHRLACLSIPTTPFASRLRPTSQFGDSRSFDSVSASELSPW